MVLELMKKKKEMQLNLLIFLILKRILKQYPNTIIHTSGLDVGLPDGQMGNSEVGHTNIGAGRIIYQELTRITKSIEDGDFFSISEFITAIENCKRIILNYI